MYVTHQHILLEKARRFLPVLCSVFYFFFLFVFRTFGKHTRKNPRPAYPICHKHLDHTSALARLNFLHTPIREKRSFFCFFFLLLFFFTFSLSMSSSSKSLRSKTSDLSNRAHIHTYKKTMRSARLQFLGHTRLISNTRKCEKVKRRSRIRAQNDYM